MAPPNITGAHAWRMDRARGAAVMRQNERPIRVGPYMKRRRVALRIVVMALMSCTSAFGGDSPAPPVKSDPAARDTPPTAEAASAQKIAYLESLVSEHRQALDPAAWKRYVPIAAKDPDVDVRHWVASLGLLDDATVPLFIEVLMNDPEYEVRSIAAITLSDWITANGAETCSAAREVEQHLPALLRGLNDGATAQQVVEIVGGRYSGEKPLACCMRRRSRDLIRTSLQGRIGKTPYSHFVYWSDELPLDALRNITSCK